MVWSRGTWCSVLGMLSASHTIPFPLVWETCLWLMSLQQPVKNVTTNYSLDHSKLKIDFFHLPDGCLIGSWAGSHFRLWLNDSGQYLWLLPDRGHRRKLKHSPMLHLWQKNKFLTVWYIKGGIFSSGQNPGIAPHLKQTCQALPLESSKAKLAITSLIYTYPSETLWGFPWSWPSAHKIQIWVRAFQGDK